jgi:hypothetical protein
MKGFEGSLFTAYPLSSCGPAAGGTRLKQKFSGSKPREVGQDRVTPAEGDTACL